MRYEFQVLQAPLPQSVRTRESIRVLAECSMLATIRKRRRKSAFGKLTRRTVVRSRRGGLTEYFFNAARLISAGASELSFLPARRGPGLPASHDEAKRVLRSRQPRSRDFHSNLPIRYTRFCCHAIFPGTFGCLFLSHQQNPSAPLLPACRRSAQGRTCRFPTKV